MASTSLKYLIENLRLNIGDYEEPYRYVDDWLEISLQASVEALQPWWNSKYIIDSDGYVSRNTSIKFIFDEPPVIEAGDIRPIILMAMIVIKEGALENMAWSLGSWRDAEISYSNIEGGRSRDRSLERLWMQLISYLKPPQKRLAVPHRTRLPGFQPYGTERLDDK